MSRTEKFKIKHKEAHGYKNSINMFINPVYHVVLGDLSYHACKECKKMICSYCRLVDKVENRLNHEECLTLLKNSMEA